MNIIRKYKLRKLTGINYFSQKEKEIVDFIIERISNLSKFTTDTYPNEVIYFNTQNECILVYNIKNKWLRVKYEGLLESLHIKYDLGYRDSKYMNFQYFIEYMVELLYRFDAINTKLHGSTLGLHGGKISNIEYLLKNRIYEHNKEV